MNQQNSQVKRLLIILIFLIFPISGVLFSWSRCAIAQTIAQTKVTPVPSNLTVLGTRCILPNFGCQWITRNLLLRSDRGLTNLQIYSLDLNRADGAAVFPATTIHGTISQTSLQPNQPLTIPIQFDLSQIPSGEYNGTILLSYTEGELTIPLTIRVKDNPLFPLVSIVVGVVLGIGISSYRTEGMARDEILVRVGRLRVQMQADPQLDGSFERQIANYLIDVETALEAKRWEQAATAIDRAIGIWDKWRKDREEWIVQIQYRQELAKRLQQEIAINIDSWYLQSVQRQLEDLSRKTVDLPSPLQLRDVLDELQQQINRYLQGKSKLDRSQKLTEELPLDQQTAWRQKLQQIQLGLDNLSPQKIELFTSWQKNLDGTLSELIQLLEKQKTTEISLEKISSQNSAMVHPFLAPVPAVRPPKDPIEIARRRLLWFNWLSYTLAVGLLAGSGFVQLYVTKPTFGANGLGDYFMLIAWGFGAEVTRDSVTKVMKDWKFPGVKS